MNGIPFSEIPDSILESVSEKVFTYSSPLLKITFDPPDVDYVEVIGSGTFVRVGDIYGILTANHVAKNLDGECFLGLALLRDEDNFKIHKSFIKIIDIGIPNTNGYGPDIAFIMFNDTHRSDIARYKDFYPLCQNRDEALSYPPPLDVGFWAACGTPQERITLEDSASSFSAAISMQLYCAFGGVEREYIKDDYDYFEMDADYAKAKNVPHSFKGMSGGGLWQIPITFTDDNNIIVNRYLLSGVAFWQSNQSERKSFLRFHARKSIYENMWDAIVNYNRS